MPGVRPTQGAQRGDTGEKVPEPEGTQHENPRQPSGGGGRGDGGRRVRRVGGRRMHRIARHRAPARRRTHPTPAGRPGRATAGFGPYRRTVAP
ncbi:hypothetical protein GCM10010216_45960 [Streptomyces flaveolus]|nr:hypothetical protein GCM10010216_45960 [Streptomyces flaveolus]